MKPWIAEELRGCRFPDQRLGTRLERLLEQLSDRLGQSLPMACQDWANTKAAYRFFGSERVTEAEILRGHFQATQARVAAARGPILVLHDTTEFTYQRQTPAAIGVMHKTHVAYGSRTRMHTVCGILMHGSLAVTPAGVPLGLTAIKFWTRKEFKGTNRLKRHINPTRVPMERKESVRWVQNLTQSAALLGEPARVVHIGDRESDMFDLFHAAGEVGTHFLVRAHVDRLARDGTVTISREMRAVRVRGLHRVETVDRKGNASTAVLELRYRRVHVLPPRGKQHRYPGRTLTVLYAQERGTPKGRDRIHWKLLTDLPIGSRREAVEKLEWYALRWKIETFHKILKSGCQAEALRLRTAARLANVLAVFCILAWRVFWMSMVNRAAPTAPAGLAFTETEQRLLDRLVPNPPHSVRRTHIARYVTKLAQLGGYLARSRDAPPGNMVVWRGLARLTDIALGLSLWAEVMGN